MSVGKPSTPVSPPAPQSLFSRSLSSSRDCPVMSNIMSSIHIYRSLPCALLPSMLPSNKASHHILHGLKPVWLSATCVIECGSQCV